MKQRTAPTSPQPFATYRLDPADFAAAVKAARARVTHGRTLSDEGEKAARLVLVEGLRQADAARECGIKNRQQVHGWVRLIVTEHEGLTNAERHS